MIERRSRRIGTATVAIAAILVVCASVYFAWHPSLPVAVTFRPAFDGNSQVVQLHNLSDRYLAIQAVFENKTLRQEKTAIINLGPYKTVEVGWAEGWSFMSGERVTLSSETYRSRALTVP